MKNRIVYYFFIFSSLNLLTIVNAQEEYKYGQISYQYAIDEKLKDPNQEDQRTKLVSNTFFKYLTSNKEKIKYKLIFNKNESFYSIVNNMDTNSDLGLYYSKLITGGGEEIYTNIKENIKLKKVEILGDNFIVKSNLKQDWSVTQETKTIGKYKCYKAIFINAISDHKSNTNNLSVEAWFTPQIPINFGPKGYGQLPGLIIELKVGKIIYNAVEILLNKKEEITINAPKKGKILSEKEFDELLKEFDRSKSNN